MSGSVTGTASSSSTPETGIVDGAPSDKAGQVNRPVSLKSCALSDEVELSRLYLKGHTVNILHTLWAIQFPLQRYSTLLQR